MTINESSDSGNNALNGNDQPMPRVTQFDRRGAPESQPDQIVITMPSGIFGVGPAQLDDAGFVADLHAAFCGPQEFPTTSVDGLREMGRETACRAIRLLVELDQERLRTPRRGYRRFVTPIEPSSGPAPATEPATANGPYCSAGQSHPDLFTAVLALIPGMDNVPACARGQALALDGARIIFSGDSELRVACTRIKNRLNDLGIRGVRVDTLIEQAQQPIVEDAPIVVEGPAALTRVSDVLPDAPVPPDTVVPPGWEISQAGVFRQRDTQLLVPAPILITGRYRDVATGTERVGYAHLTDGRWHERIVMRSTIADRRRLIDESDFGAPVNSSNVNEIVDYLAAFEAANSLSLPRTNVTAQLGWHRVGTRDFFMWGRQPLSGSRPAPSQGPAQPLPPNADLVFQEADTGSGQLCRAFQSRGSVTEWQAAINMVREYPRVLLSLYAALSPPLLQILDSPNFTVSFAGSTSQGKTSALKVGGSAWGNPDKRSPASVLHTWDNTAAWIERAAELMNDLPLLLDDTREARDPRAVTQTLYHVAGGCGRGRGSIDGIRHIATYRTVMIITGEAPATSFTQDGGSRARTLEIWGSPFGRADAETGRLVTNLNMAVQSHHGHAGPRFVQYLLDHQLDWHAWRQRYLQRCNNYMALSQGNPVAVRMAAHFGVLDLVAQLVHESLVLPWEYAGTIEQLWPELTTGSHEADRAAAALRHIYSWCVANRGRFDGPSGRQNLYVTDCVGRWQEVGGRLEFIALLPHIAERVLAEGGFENPDAIRRLWHERGWTRGQDGRSTFKTRVAGESTWVVRIERQPILDICGGCDAGAPTGPESDLSRFQPRSNSGNNGNGLGTPVGTT